MKRPKKLTFLWCDLNSNRKINTLQWQTTRRTVSEAWNDAVGWLVERWKKHRIETDEDFLFEIDPGFIMAFDGHPRILDDDERLRAATKEELKKFAS